ncbi:MAG: methyltransferase domain-containing protein [Micropepsaceae bacterium]
MANTQSNAEQITFWNGDAGLKWVRSQERLDGMLSGISAELIRTANVTASDRVLDVGCGCGETSIAMSKSGAAVTGIDISAPMLAHAKHRAPKLSFIEADASSYRFERNFSLLFSRFGVMFFANPDEAFRNMRSAVASNGRLAFACWRDWRENEWVRAPMAAVRPHVSPQPQMGPEDPGPFSFADPARVRRILNYAGFDQIAITPFDAAMQLGSDLDEACTHIQEVGPVSRMLADSSPQQKLNAVNALRDALTPYAANRPFTMGGAVWIVTAKA